jgi:hypothetical protein
MEWTAPTEYETGGLDRRNSCGHGVFGDLAIIAHLVLAILSVLPDGARSLRTAQRGVVRARRRARDRKVGKFSNRRMYGVQSAMLHISKRRVYGVQCCISCPRPHIHTVLQPQSCSIRTKLARNYAVTALGWRPAPAAARRHPLPRPKTHRFGTLSALHARTKPPHELDLLWQMLRAFSGPGGPDGGRTARCRSDHRPPPAPVRPSILTGLIVPSNLLGSQELTSGQQ